MGHVVRAFLSFFMQAWWQTLAFGYTTNVYIKISFYPIANAGVADAASFL